MYAKVIIETKTDNVDTLYTYGSELPVATGSVVRVPFGRGNRLRDAYVVETAEELEEPVRGLKYIAEVCEDVSLTDEMVETALFMRRRYLCRMIDAIECFLPAGSASKRGKERKPLSKTEADVQDIEALTAEQQGVLSKISPALQSKKHEIFLLHGVTGSGKTEVYMRAISEVISSGRTALMLVPEISLTAQIVQRFIGRFGKDNVAVLHSKLSAGERYDEWQRIRKGEARIIIGARSAVFAPASDIGLVILDEEHETSYKSDKTPKYETVEIAIKRAKAYGGSVILGSATPSVVSYQRALDGIYTLLEMKQRYNAVPLPQVNIVDMREELRAGNRTILSRRLAGGIEDCLASGKQIILFLNRRGYSTFISCRECGYVLKCPECEISLTYHKNENSAVCHYCGRKVSIPRECPECGSTHIRYFGTGTEKVEEFIRAMYPEAAIDRLDLDSVKTKGAIDRILGAFKKGRTNILIGTQLVAKGLDFKNVGLVGVISADVSLNIPDFRSPERTFQLITQASGRAGRGDERGNVIIQTYTPEHYAVQSAAKADYLEFFRQENRFRRMLTYPPYCDLFQLMFISPDSSTAEHAAMLAYDRLTEMVPPAEKNNIYKPQPSALRQEAGKYRYQMLIKVPRGKRSEISGYIAVLKNQMLEDKRINPRLDYTMLVDVNPYSLI